MATVPIPFTDEEVDTSDDATDVAMTVALVVVGFAAFSWFSSVGDGLASAANSFIASSLGVDLTNPDEDNEVPGV